MNILLTVGEQELNFAVDNAHINKLLNTMTATNKIAPFHNFLTSTVAPEDKDKLLPLIKDNALATLEIGGALLEETSPNLNITAKKL